MIKDYAQFVSIKSTPDNAFRALTHEIPKWWGSVDASADKIGDVFTITFGEAYWTFKIIDSKANELLIWECIDGQPELNNEWIGHELRWLIKEETNSIVVVFDQEGLNASLPCYDICSAAWDRFILRSLKEYLETGEGSPGS